MILRSLANKASDPRDDQQSTMQQPEASVRQKEEEERSERRELHRELNTGTQPLSPVQRTREYVQQHARPYFAEMPFEVETQELSVDPDTGHNPESSKQRSMSRDSPAP
ncbi:unnamed protein product [Coregonus sp. 'balchen']|nr:unnamed protein product [Coregonus sp. 'balchen']